VGRRPLEMPTGQSHSPPVSVPLSPRAAAALAVGRAAPSEGHPAGLAGRPTPAELRSHALALHALAERFDRRDVQERVSAGWLTDLADELHRLAEEVRPC
jgi:hypothetical protein